MVAHIHQCHLDTVPGHAVKYQTGRICLAADAQRMYLDLRLIGCKGCRYFEHMGRQLQLPAFGQIVGIVLDKAGRTVTPFGHLHQHGRKCADLIIALRAETDALFHQILGGNARQLCQSVQILEGIGKGIHAIGCNKFLDCHLIAGLFSDSVHIVRGHRIFFRIFCHLGIDLRLGCLCGQLCQLTDAVIFDFPAIFDFTFQTVAVGHGNVTHIVTKGGDAGVFRNSNGFGHLGKLADLFYHMRVLIISGHDLMRNIQPCQNIAIFTVAMRRLVQIHKIHVDRIVGQLLVGLGVQVQQRFVKLLQTFDPHLCRRKRVHPCNHTDTAVVGLGFSHILQTAFRCLDYGQQLDLDRIFQLFI